MEELFQSLILRYQIGLEKLMERSEFVFEICSFIVLEMQ